VQFFIFFSLLSGMFLVDVSSALLSDFPLHCFGSTRQVVDLVEGPLSFAEWSGQLQM